jgi:simple sugar transport system ATP-binding protein
MAMMMIGDQQITALDSRKSQDEAAPVVLAVKSLKAPDRSGLKSINIEALEVRAGEIVGVAGISGNGQKEFLEVLAGQRPRSANFGAARL